MDASPKSGGWNRSTSPYHAGEQLVQERAGSREMAELVGRQVIRDFMPDQHREFFKELPFVLIGTIDELQRPWASLLCGQRGFLSTPDPKTLTIRAPATRGDPISPTLQVGAPVAILGIEMESRRRNRVNGWVSRLDKDGFDLTVDQSFGNCPQYIQSRQVHSPEREQSASGNRQTHLEGKALSSRAVDLIRNADTFFIASASPNATKDDPVEGTDVNHRGGKPGFVRIVDKGEQSEITWADFSGNYAFNTLGNISANPVAGLLFVDFESGDVLSITGAAEILWDDPEAPLIQGAQRLVRLRVVAGFYVSNAIPFRWSAPKLAPELERTGVWPEAGRSLQDSRRPVASKQLVVQRIEQESLTVRSYYLVSAHDGESLLSHQAGQFLPIVVPMSDETKEASRSFTISNAPAQGAYRISIKRVRREDGSYGVVSDWFHKHATVGTVLRTWPPQGTFVVDPSSTRPLVLISGGIGITPFISILDSLAAGSTAYPSLASRKVCIVHCARNSDDLAFGDHLRALASADPEIRVHLRFSQPLTSDVEGIDFHSSGRIDRRLFQLLFPMDDYEYYVCGPQLFMQHVCELLRGLGVRTDRIRTESFDPANFPRDEKPAEQEGQVTQKRGHALIQFSLTGRTVEWSPESGSILRAAEAMNIVLPSSCRMGTCGSCRTKVVTGQVAYSVKPSAETGSGSALLCCAYPTTPELVLEA